MMTVDAMQRQVDDAYPPTHTYRIGWPPTPTGVLAERAAIIAREFPQFFYGERLLDVGCSKGFFAFAHAHEFGEVIGVDADADAIALCRGLRVHCGQRPQFLNIGFRDYFSAQRFDRILIGNGPHHLYREIGGHEWINKLAALSSGLVLTEGPVDITCPDLVKQPDTYKADYNHFGSMMWRHFDLLKRVPSVSYSPGRHMMLWRRKRLAPEATGPFFAKQFRHDEYTDNNEVDVFVASTSPISNGMVRFVEGGWQEMRDDAKPFRYFENERQLFALHCGHQVYLAKLGYVDIDPATINFFRGSLWHFDKSCVMPIRRMRARHAAAYTRLLAQSYRDPNITGIAERLHAALSSGIATDIGKVFAWAQSQL